MPRRGDILLHRGSGFVSRMIRAITQSRVSHAGWMLSPTEILESDWQLWGEKGVHVNEIEKYRDDLGRRRVIFVRPAVSDAEIEAAIARAREHIGQRYDWSLFWSLLKKWVLRKRSDRDQRNGWICSELVAKPLYEACGFTFRDDVPVGEIVPGDIYESAITGRVAVVEGAV